jgi:nitric oxide synthase oxygenase domain/subunit
MKREIAKYVSECDTCQRVKASHLRASGTLQPLPISSWKWEDISMDFIVGLPNTSQKHDSIWVIIDRLTKTAHFLPVHTTYSAKKYVEIYLDQIVRLDGVPKTIISNQGAQFIARFWEQLQYVLGTKLFEVLRIILRRMDRLSESTKFWKTCSELVLFTMVQARTNVLPWPSSLTTIAINLVFKWLPLKRYTVEDVELL